MTGRQGAEEILAAADEDLSGLQCFRQLVVNVVKIVKSRLNQVATARCCVMTVLPKAGATDLIAMIAVHVISIVKKPCTLPFATTAATNAKSLSVQPAVSRYIAANVLTKWVAVLTEVEDLIAVGAATEVTVAAVLIS